MIAALDAARRHEPVLGAAGEPEPSWLSVAARKLYTVGSLPTPITSFHARIGTSASCTPRTSSSLPSGYSRYASVAGGGSC